MELIATAWRNKQFEYSGKFTAAKASAALHCTALLLKFRGDV